MRGSEKRAIAEGIACLFLAVCLWWRAEGIPIWMEPFRDVGIGYLIICAMAELAYAVAEDDE